jgi:hypothetical protein
MSDMNGYAPDELASLLPKDHAIGPANLDVCFIASLSPK